MLEAHLDRRRFEPNRRGSFFPKSAEASASERGFRPLTHLEKRRHKIAQANAPSEGSLGEATKSPESR
jgi:hypothetical protein